jgi:Homeodomain-like domain
MMPGTAAKVVFSERQMIFLEELANSRTEEIRLVQRAKTILLAYQKRNNEQIGEVVGMNPQAVSVWRKRWKAKFEELIRIECNEPPEKLKAAIRTLLSDLPRAGRKPTFSTEQQAAVVGLACEKPDDSDRPISHWTQREIADEAVKRGLVPAISASRVGHFLKSSRRSPSPK